MYISIILLVVACLIFASGMIRYIPNDRVGIVEKLWSATGSIEGGIIALKGEAGYQPGVLRGGVHFFRPFQFRVHKVKLVTITQGKIGYVFARDGKSLGSGQTLASNMTAQEFENATAFLTNGGQKGPQRKILREGAYALNLALFTIVTSDGLHAMDMSKEEEGLYGGMQRTIAERNGFAPIVIKDNVDQVGVVTVHDGQSLPNGEIIAPLVGAEVLADGYHNNFQDPDVFTNAGGFRGRQLQVLVDGTYYINALFATVEMIKKTVVPVGFVGVVVSYTGPLGTDVSDSEYRHGELVATGCRGVWLEPLMPGKYAFNTYSGEVIIVPTTNFILKWASKNTSDHLFDQNLKEVTLITKDAFEPSLPLSIVVHIDYKKAPYVVQRFGDIQQLVEQTLDPMVSSYFKSSSQSVTLIELLQKRSEIQKSSSDDMRDKFAMYSLTLLEVLIGTPRSQEGNVQIEEILKQLRDRQVAQEQIATFASKEQAAGAERTLREAEAKAAQQGELTAAALSIQMKASQGEAEVAYASQAAKRIEIEASAQKMRDTLEGEGEAARIVAVGEAKAKAAQAQAEAFGGPETLVSRDIAEMFTTALREGNIAITPQIQMGGGSGTPADAMLATVLASMSGVPVSSVSTIPAMSAGKAKA